MKKGVVISEGDLESEKKRGLLGGEGTLDDKKPYPGIKIRRENHQR